MTSRSQSGGVTNDTYDTSLSLISSENRFGFVPRRTIAPGEMIRIADVNYLSEISFREDYGSSEAKFEVYKNEGNFVPYTNLDTISTSYRFEDTGKPDWWRYGTKDYL